MLPDIDLKAIRGIVPAELVVYYDSAGNWKIANGRIETLIRDELVFSRISKSHGYFALSVANPSRVEQIVRWAKQQTGVREAHAEVLQEVILNRSLYEQRHRPTGMEASKEAPRMARLSH
jgi:hypothetical protein